MVPCPGFEQFADWAASHPEADVGVHFTLTSQPLQRWAPIAGASMVPSLVDADGMFPVGWKPERSVRLSDLDTELRAQIAAARRRGIELTHLDAHQHVLQLRGPGIYGVFERVAREERLPFRFVRSWGVRAPYALSSEDRTTVVLERMIAISPNDAVPETWADWYSTRVSQIPPGLSEMLVHVGFDDDELRAAVPDTAPWGSGWRERDLDVVMGGKLSEAIRRGEIVRTGWRPVRDYLRAG